MPKVTPKMFAQLGIGEEYLKWEEAKRWDVIGEGITVKRGEALFPRVDLSQFEEEEKKTVDAVKEEKTAEKVLDNTAEIKAPENKAEETTEFEPIKEEITIEDFAKIDLRVAKVLHAEKVEKADKLLKLEIEVGGKTRTIVSGIAQYYAPEELVGKKVVIVANLKPAKLRGIMSEGMILAASHDGVLEVLTLDKDLKPGARVK